MFSKLTFVIFILSICVGCDINGPPVISVGNVTVTEGDGGSKKATIEVSLSKKSDKNVSVKYRTEGLDAEINQDFFGDEGELQFQAGETSQIISLQIIGDLLYEADEEFMVQLYKPVNAEFKQENELLQNIGLVSIKNDDLAPKVSLLTGQLEMQEGDGLLTIKVLLDKKSAHDTQVEFSVGGTASRNDDFIIMVPGFVNVAAGKLEAEFDVLVTDDKRAECAETLILGWGDLHSKNQEYFQQLTIKIHDDDVKGQEFQVGKDKMYKTPGSVSKIAKSGDVVNIAAGLYKGDVAVWRQNDLLLCGDEQGVNMVADGKAAGGKGIWVIKGDRVTVQNITFRDAKVPDRNGAGIRYEGKNLLVRYSEFENNQNGILVSNIPDSVVVVEHSKFIKNGAGDGQSHNIYVGSIKRFETTFSEYSGAHVGHNIKSRAATNIISYNRVFDGEKGDASYQIDLPSGGFSVLVGNTIQQGPLAENSALVSYGVEGFKHKKNHLILANNTLVNDRHSGIFGKIAKGATVQLFNNLFVGKAEGFTSVVNEKNNITAKSFEFFNARQQDYRLIPDSPAIDAGEVVKGIDGVSLVSKYEYRVNGVVSDRRVDNKIDVGAFEFESLQ